ncbi:uncharacterized protein LOC142239684 [Haematobia irritans]|uniref:uncharacterized protein LOC142239684 n=1 Tax=Haematobia irritans TaxID=7368 RepID=UPI003F4F8105
MEEKIIENNLQSILKNLHGEKFISILEEHSINEESLKFITKSHLDVIIPRSRYGEQIIFEHHLKIWQQQQFASDNPSVSHNNSIFELPIPKTSVSEVSFTNYYCPIIIYYLLLNMKFNKHVIG